MIVESISSKPVTTKFGTKATYSFKADGDWYKCGFKKPSIKEGDEITFTHTEGAYGKEVDVASISVVGGRPATPAAPKAAPAPSYGSKGVFPIPALDGQRAIVRQNSLTNAVNLIKDHLDPKKATNFEDVAGKCIDIARMFEAYSCGDLDLAVAKAKIAKAVPAVTTEDNPTF